MYGIFYTALVIFWIMDILNLPFMQMFDTTYPINGWFWLLVWILIPSATAIIKNKDNK